MKTSPRPHNPSEYTGIDSQPDKTVRLTPISKDTVDRLVRWRSQPEAQQHQPISALSREQLLSFIEQRKSSDLASLEDNEYILIIEDEGNGEGVGWLTLEITSRLHCLARIGYTIDREQWGQGYATAAVKAIVRWLFTETVVERVEADCSIDNPASKRVLEKCGFRQVGIKHGYLVIHGRRVDHYNFERLKENDAGA